MKIEINKAAVSLVLMTPSLQVVRVSRKYDHTNFGLPGGKVELGESITDALVRETKEEIGFDLVYDKTKHPMIYAAYTKNGYMNYTFLAIVNESEISNLSTTEPHVIETCPLATLGLDEGSSFQEYNLHVAHTIAILLQNSNKDL